jgi:hypothetical protein
MQTLLLASLAMAALAATLVHLGRRGFDVPAHLCYHPVHYDSALLSAAAVESLMQLAQTVGDFPTVIGTDSQYRITHESVGEDSPISEGGVCEHPFLVPNAARTACILPGRIDVGRHFVKTGGVNALKEKYETLVSRLQSFMYTIFDPSKHAATRDLFGDPKFLSAATSVCPPGKRVLDPFQTNLIVQAPGQTVAAHVDAPYYWGANRFHIPQWLLAVMTFSGIFQERFIDQVQVVAYFHKWNDTSGSRGGQFLFWDKPSLTPQWVPAAPGSGSAVDGSKLVHAAAVYQPSAAPPPLAKDARNALRYAKDADVWQLVTSSRAGGEEQLRTRYTADQLRFSVVYRARCFASEAERLRYRAEGPADMLRLEEDILAPLKDELVRRGRATAAELGALTRLDLALRLLDDYVAYPTAHDALIPLNYCALSRLIPALTPLLNLFC